MKMTVSDDDDGDDDDNTMRGIHVLRTRLLMSRDIHDALSFTTWIPFRLLRYCLLLYTICTRRRGKEEFELMLFNHDDKVSQLQRKSRQNLAMF